MVARSSKAIAKVGSSTPSKALQAETARSASNQGGKTFNIIVSTSSVLKNMIAAITTWLCRYGVVSSSLLARNSLLARSSRQ